LKADELGHQMLEPGGAAYGPAVEAFGREILDEDGRINRRRLGAEVFSDPERLALLNSFVHPAVIAAEEAWIAEKAAADRGAICVVEAAILIETGSWRRFDKLVLAVCTRKQQIERAMKRDGLSRREVENRLARQMPLKQKQKYADYVINTSANKEMTAELVRQLYGTLRAIQGKV
jgi:dephospho-CoA kinase